MHYLYRITDMLNDKVYIGQSNKENERWRQHKYFARKEYPVQYISRAMKKYGVENFIYEVIACCLTQEYADETEMQLIKQYDSQNKEKGYNVALGGDHAWNAGLPKELNPLTGRIRSEETRRKISEGNMGKIMPPHSQKWKDHMSKIMTGRTLPPEQIEKIAVSNRGQKRSEETKLNVSRSHIGIQAGEKHPQAKVNWTIVRSIRKEYFETKISQTALAKKYNVTHAIVWAIVNNKTWKE